jgi:exopolyphosphatase/guanosine-5'-triphosphate,3'-diphosphate pyrophosphatase
MKYASIDTGTNTLRLLIAEKAPHGALKPLLYKRAITRLGGSYTVEAGMDSAAMERSVRALVDFAAIIGDYGAGRVRATATSVVRRAVNRDFFIGEVRKRAGIEIEVIDGLTEAGLTLCGVNSVITGQAARSLVMDIGGGSTEFIVTRDGVSKGAWSLEMGVVRLTEKFLGHDPPMADELEAMEDEIRGKITWLRERMGAEGVNPTLYNGADALFIGTAGTITTIAALDQSLDEYERDKINNYRLSKERVDFFYKYLAGLTIKEKKGLAPLEQGREDLIIPGAAITKITMEAFDFNEIRVSDAGLLEGLIIKMTEDYGGLD